MYSTNQKKSMIAEKKFIEAEDLGHLNKNRGKLVSSVKILDSNVMKSPGRAIELKEKSKVKQCSEITKEIEKSWKVINFIVKKKLAMIF